MKRAYLLAFAFLILVDVAFLSPALFISAVRAPADVTPHWPAFQADGPDPPAARNELLNDWLQQFHPWQHLVRDAWNSGRLPLWNDKSGCGEPLIGNSQSEAFSPFLPLSLLSGDQYVDWRQLAQTVVAQVFCVLLAAHLGLSAAAALVSALAYSFSSFMQIWAIHPHSASACFAPGILWALLRVTGRPTGTRFLVAAACVALSILAGHVETAAKAGLMAGAIVLLMSVFKKPAAGRLRAAALTAGAGVSGILLAACLLAPFVDYVSQSDVRELRTVFASQHVTPISQLATLLNPGWFGSPLNPTTYRGAPDYPDGVLHLGVVPLALAAIGLVLGIVRRIGLVLPLVAVGAGGVAIACCSAEFARAWATVPVLGAIWPWRFLFVAVLPLSLLSGIGFDELSRRAARLAPRTRRAVGAVILIGASLSATLPWYGFLPSAPVSDLRPPSRALEQLAARAGAGRSIELGRILPPGFGEIYGFPRIIRDDAIGLLRLSQMLDTGEGNFPVFPDGADLTFAPSPRLDALSVRWVLSSYPAADARFPMKPERVEPGPGTTVDLARVPKLRGSLDVVITRAMDQETNDGSIEVAIGRAGTERIWSLGPSGWVASEGEPPLAPDAPEVVEFLRTGLKRFRPTAFSVPPALLDPAAHMTFRLKREGAGFWVTALLPGGIGTDVVEVDNLGSLRISERRSALPFAYLSPGVTRATGLTEAAGLVHSEAFDPHVATVVEALSARALPAAAPPSAGDRVTIVNREPGAIDVQVTTAADRLLVVTDAYARGWEATVDGVSAPIYPANLVGMSCRVPAGHHVVRLSYAPWSFIAGCATSALTLLLLLALAVRGAWRRRSVREAVVG